MQPSLQRFRIIYSVRIVNVQVMSAGKVPKHNNSHHNTSVKTLEIE